MKKLFIALALMAGIAPAVADSTVVVPDNFKTTMQQTQTTFQLCLGAMAMHGNTETCAAISNMLAQLGALTLTPIVTTTVQDGLVVEKGVPSFPGVVSSGGGGYPGNVANPPPPAAQKKSVDGNGN